MSAEVHDDASSPSLSSARLANFSDGIFGVAMTLLSTTLILPIQTLTGSALGMLHDISGGLSSVVLSFAISATFWLSQQRRLSSSLFLTAWQTWLQFIFLFLIVLLPISTDLSGRLGATRPVVLIYGTHLVLISLSNLLLWIQIHRNTVVNERIMGASLTLASFIAAVAIGAVRPAFVQYLWFAGFAMPWLGRHLMRSIARTSYARPSIDP